MRILQIIVFVLGVMAFLASLAFMGKQVGDDLWRAGIALMASDAVLLLLFPVAGRIPPRAGAAANRDDRRAEEVPG